jgi:hypothetical protein
MPVSRHTNEVIGAYARTGARRKLYTYLESMKEKAIYFDTYSVIYLQKCGQPPGITCGDKLGEMTNELDPHEYAYKIVNSGINEKIVYKVRQISLIYSEFSSSTLTAQGHDTRR